MNKRILMLTFSTFLLLATLLHAGTLTISSTGATSTVIAPRCTVSIFWR